MNFELENKLDKYRFPSLYFDCETHVRQGHFLPHLIFNLNKEIFYILRFQFQFQIQIIYYKPLSYTWYFLINFESKN